MCVVERTYGIIACVDEWTYGATVCVGERKYGINVCVLGNENMYVLHLFL